MNLSEYTKQYSNRTDKYDLGYIDNIYNDLFTPIRNSVQFILEIGIDRGNSITLWRDYFINAQISCVDIKKCDRLIGQDRIFPCYTDAYSLEFVNTLENNHYDIIIDDGPHTLDSMMFFMSFYLDKVKPNGFLILEDIIDTSWTSKLISLIDSSKHSIQTFDMRNKQLNSTLLNRWKNGLDVVVVKKGIT